MSDVLRGPTGSELQDEPDKMKTMRVVGSIVSLLAIIPLGLGGLWYQKNTEFLDKAVPVEAKVVSVKERCVVDGVTYYPVYAFFDRNGQERRVESRFGSSPPVHEFGESVFLWYDRDDPTKWKVESFIPFWLGPAIVAGLAVIPILIGGFIGFLGPVIYRAATQNVKGRAASVTDTAPDASTERDEKARMWAMMSHMTALSVFAGIPFGNLLAPLVVWRMRRKVFPIVDAHAKESLNFQISMTLYGVMACILCLVLIGFVLLPAVCITNIVLVIIASLRADNGDFYQYPFTLRLLR